MKMSIIFACILAVTVAANDVPQEIDWREKGVISEVKDQGSCEATTYFAGLGVVESHYYISTGEKISLSEQSIIDCSIGFNDGCNGGSLLFTLDFVRSVGTTFEENYPYVGRLENCQLDYFNTVFRDIGYEILRRDEELIHTIVGTIGPVAVSFDGSNLSSYTGGIYNDPSCNPNLQTHAGIIVGYGTTHDGEDYWTIKMPYGTSWGEDGYFRMARNINACGIVNNAAYPVFL